MRPSNFWSWFRDIFIVVGFWSSFFVYNFISERRRKKQCDLINRIRRGAFEEALSIAEQHEDFRTASAIRDLMEMKL
jgi:hypothetical protein